MKRTIIVFLLALTLFGLPALAQDVASIAIDPETADLTVGDELVFSAVASDADGNAVDAEIGWTVDGDIGTVDDEGEFKATTAGTGSVIASVGDITASAAVTVSAGQGGGGQGGSGDGADGNSDQGGGDGEPGGPGDGADGNSDQGDGGEGDDAEEPSVSIFPRNPWVAVDETIQFELEMEGADENADTVWAVSDEEIGTIDGTGLFTAVKVGTVTVTATRGELSDEVSVDVTDGTPPDGQSGNLVRFQRERNGRITQFGSAISENNSITIGGIPSPMNYLNGMKLFFPENSLSEDITITIKIPSFAKTNSQSGDVEFDGDIVTAVTFEVSVDGEVVEPYNFDTPIEVTLPYKKGLLNNLGIDPTNLSMFYVDENGELVQDGISGLALDEESGMIKGMCAHFSDVALAPDQGDPTLVEAGPAPEGFALDQNFPNPFNPVTTISYNLAASSNVSMNIYSVVGQHVKTLVDGVMPAGAHSVTWDGTDDAGRQVTSGIYFYSITAGDFNMTRKLMLLR